MTPAWSPSGMGRPPAGGGMVISPDLLSDGDAEMLQDMILSAVNEALRQADDAMSKTMDGIGSGLNLGAFGL